MENFKDLLENRSDKIKTTSKISGLRVINNEEPSTYTATYL